MTNITSTPRTAPVQRADMTAVQRAAEVAILSTLVGGQEVSAQADTAAEVASKRVKAANALGAAEAKVERDSDVLATAVMETLPEDFDPKVRGAVKRAIHAYMTNNGAIDQPAVAKGPKGAQVDTNYGRGVNNVAKEMNKRLATPKALPEVASITVTLGKSATAPGQTMTFAPDADGYADLLAMLAGSAVDES